MSETDQKTDSFCDGMKLAIIPARGGSKGLPGKNLAEVAGKSLVFRAVRSVIESGKFDKIICSTDSREIAEMAATAGAEIPFIRPDELASDTSSSMDVVFHAVDEIQQAASRTVSLVGLFEPTTPLRTAGDVSAAFKLLEDNPDSDAVVSVTDAGHAHPAWLQKIIGGHLRRYFDDTILPMPTRRQDFDSMPRPLMLNGAIYIAKLTALESSGSFLTGGIKTLAYEMPPERSVNIDSELDLVTARAFADFYNLD